MSSIPSPSPPSTAHPTFLAIDDNQTLLVGDSDSLFRTYSLDAFILSATASRAKSSTSSGEEEEEEMRRRVPEEVLVSLEEEEGGEKRVVGAGKIRLPLRHIPFQQEQEEQQGDAEVFVVGTQDGRLVFIDSQQGEILLSFSIGQPLLSVAVCQDSKYILSFAEDQPVAFLLHYEADSLQFKLLDWTLETTQIADRWGLTLPSSNRPSDSRNNNFVLRELVTMHIHFCPRTKFIVFAFNNGGFCLRRWSVEEGGRKISCTLVKTGRLKQSIPINFIAFDGQLSAILTGGCDGVCRILNYVEERREQTETKEAIV